MHSHPRNPWRDGHPAEAPESRPAWPGEGIGTLVGSGHLSSVPGGEVDATLVPGPFSRHTGQPIERIARDTERDRYLTAMQAKEYGLVDEVVGRIAASEKGPGTSVVSTSPPGTELK